MADLSVSGFILPVVTECIHAIHTIQGCELSLSKAQISAERLS